MTALTLNAFTLVFVGLILNGCTHAPVKPGKDEAAKFERRQTEEYFVSSGAIQYFLSDLPVWANSSIGGKCQRDESIRYMNYKKLMDSFGYSYSQAVQFQYSYNIEKRKRENVSDADVFPFKNQEKLFFNISDRIESNIKAFRVPSYERVHLIWIDPALKKDGGLKKLKNLMAKDEMDEGYPVFVSFCLYREQLQSFIEKNDFRSGIRLMTYEMLNIYTPEGEISPIRHLVVDHLFKDNQRLIFYYPRSWEIPPELKGAFEKKPY